MPITNIITPLSPHFIYLYSYELVFLNPEDYKKFGYRPAQANAMKNGVIHIYSPIKFICC